jgi:hypothetical protein
MPGEEVIERAREDKRQGTEHPGWRICPRRDGAHSRRKARGAVAAAGDCHRAFKGPTCWRCLTSPEGYFGENARAGSSGHGKRANVRKEKTFQGALAGNFRGTEERREIGGVARESIPAGQVRCAAARPPCAAPICH